MIRVLVSFWVRFYPKLDTVFGPFFYMSSQYNRHPINLSLVWSSAFSTRLCSEEFTINFHYIFKGVFIEIVSFSNKMCPRMFIESEPGFFSESLWISSTFSNKISTTKLAQREKVNRGRKGTWGGLLKSYMYSPLSSQRYNDHFHQSTAFYQPLATFFVIGEPHKNDYSFGNPLN